MKKSLLVVQGEIDSLTQKLEEAKQEMSLHKYVISTLDVKDKENLYAKAEDALMTIETRIVEIARSSKKSSVGY